MTRLALPPRGTKVLESDGTMAHQWYNFFSRAFNQVARALPPVGDGTSDTATAAITMTPWTSQRCDPTGGGFTITLPPLIAGNDDMEVAIVEVGGSTNQLRIIPAALPVNQTILGATQLNTGSARITTHLRADVKQLNWVRA